MRKKSRSRIRDEHPGSYFFWELSIGFLGKIYLNFFDADPDPGSCQPWIRDGKYRILDPGKTSRIRNTGTSNKHCLSISLSISLEPRLLAEFLLGKRDLKTASNQKNYFYSFRLLADIFPMYKFRSNDRSGSLWFSRSWHFNWIYKCHETVPLKMGLFCHPEEAPLGILRVLYNDEKVVPIRCHHNLVFLKNKLH